jgi:hypothetical protein
MIKAKAVSNKFWILKDDSGKIGEINAIRSGYTININGNKVTFDSLENLKTDTGIEFTKIHTKPMDDCKTIYGFPYSGDKFNETWNIKTQMPLFTKSDDSKSWFVAGYFSVKIKGKWRTILSPKLLILERNEYKGPFKTIPNDNEVIVEPYGGDIVSKLSFGDNSPLVKWFK